MYRYSTEIILILKSILFAKFAFIIFNVQKVKLILSWGNFFC